MRYRVDDLARACGVTVDTVRFYQTRGLLDPPQREGRVAWYDEAHRRRLQAVRELKDAGFTLAMVERALAGELDASERALAAAIVSPVPGQPGDARTFSTDELADHLDVAPALLEALEREELLTPGTDAEGRRRYTETDAAFVAAGRVLLESGVPLSELLELARRHDAAMRATADHAVELFARFVRDPIRAEAADDDAFAAQSVAALTTMLPATTELVSHHFQRLLLAAARRRLEAVPEHLDAEVGGS